MDLERVLAQLREAGVTRGRYATTDADGTQHVVEVQFGPDRPPVATGIVDKDGAPVDLDKGNPWAEDPIEEKYRPSKGKPAS